MIYDHLYGTDFLAHSKSSTGPSSASFFFPKYPNRRKKPLFRKERYMQPQLKESLTSYIENLPALSTSIGKIMEVCNDPNSSPAELSRVISLDPVLMGRVMHLINSAYYGLNNRVTSLVRAIIMLGFNTVKNLALSTAVLGSMGKTQSQIFDMEGFWVHSLSVGVTAKLIAQKRRVPSQELEELFVAGLLHDIGKIPFINIIPQKYNQAIRYAEQHSISLQEAEKEILSCDHTQVGEMIVSRWELGERLQHVTSYHHGEYTGPYKSLVYSVCAANFFVNFMEIGFSGDKFPLLLEEEIYEELGVNLDHLQEMEEEIRHAIERARIFLNLPI